MKLYLAGPMSGLPDWNYPYFIKVEAALVDQGYEIVNPARLHPAPNATTRVDWNNPEWTRLWRQFVVEDLQHLMQCDGIAALKGWRKSRGARVELNVASGLRMPCFEVKENPDSINSWGKFVLVEYPIDDLVRELQNLGADVLMDVIGNNAASHGGHAEWLSRTPNYHLRKSSKHALAAQAILDMYESPRNGEGAVEHIERAVVRSLMALRRYRDMTC